VGLTAIPDSIALDVGLAARSCHKSGLTNRKKKTNEEKEKKI
jgi:hypothetical protein